MKEKPSICVVGIGFVGLTLSISLCDAGYRVLALEKDLNKSSRLKRGVSDVSEPGLEIKLSRYLKLNKLQFNPNSSEFATASTFIVTVGTPLLNNKIDVTSIQAALSDIAGYLKDGDLVIMRSTTAVGTCREIVLPLLKASGKDIKLAMAPERTVEGRALEEMSSLPQIIGALDEESLRAAVDVFQSIGCECVSVSTLEAAELAKLINNTYRDLMFAFANEVAMVSHLYSLNPVEIIESANYKYERSNIAMPGISGGPCLEKDPWILSDSGSRRGLHLQISTASRRVNEEVIRFFLGKKLDVSTNYRKIAILGLAFKGYPETLDTRGSPALPTLEILSDMFPSAEYWGFEPAGEVVLTETKMKITNSLRDALFGADLVVILTNSRFWELVPENDWRLVARDCLVLDFWKRDTNLQVANNATYISWATGVR